MKEAAEIVDLVYTESVTLNDPRDDVLYAALKSAEWWNSNGDITLDGVKYCRIKKEGA